MGPEPIRRTIQRLLVPVKQGLAPGPIRTQPGSLMLGSDEVLREFLRLPELQRFREAAVVTSAFDLVHGHLLGSGFLIKKDNRTYLYTARHNAYWPLESETQSVSEFPLSRVASLSLASVSMSEGAQLKEGRHMYLDELEQERVIAALTRDDVLKIEVHENSIPLGITPLQADDILFEHTQEVSTTCLIIVGKSFSTSTPNFLDEKDDAYVKELNSKIKELKVLNSKLGNPALVGEVLSEGTFAAGRHSSSASHGMSGSMLLIQADGLKVAAIHLGMDHHCGETFNVARPIPV